MISLPEVEAIICDLVGRENHITMTVKIRRGFPISRKVRDIHYIYVPYVPRKKRRSK